MSKRALAIILAVAVLGAAGMLAVAFLPGAEKLRQEARDAESRKAAEQGAARETGGNPLVRHGGARAQRPPEPPPPAIVPVPDAPTNEVSVAPEGSMFDRGTTEPAAPRPPIQAEAPPPSYQISPQGASGPDTRSLAVPQEALSQRPPGGGAAAPRDYRAATPGIAPGRYLFQNLSPSALAGPKLLGGEEQPSEDINLATFAPEGERIELATVNSIASNSFEVDVVAGVWHPFFFNGRMLLDVGDRLIGTAAAGKKRDRITVTWKKVIDKRGRSLPIEAIALSPDGTSGVRGYLVGNIFLSAIGPITAELTAGVLDALRTQAEQSTSLAGVTVSSSKTSGAQNVLDALGQGGSKSLDKLGDILMEDLEENRPYVFVPAGTRCSAFLKKHLDTSKFDYGR